MVNRWKPFIKVFPTEMSLNSCLTYLHLFATLLWLTYDFSATVCAHLYFWMIDLSFNCTCSRLTYDLSVTRLSFWWRLSKTRYIWFAEENKPVDCRRTTENKVFIAYMNMPLYAGSYVPDVAYGFYGSTV